MPTVNYIEKIIGMQDVEVKKIENDVEKSMIGDTKEQRLVKVEIVKFS